MDDHFIHSSLLEKMLEQLFVAEVTRCLWRRGRRDFEVLHSAVDSRGYDIVIETGGILRHIQLKSSYDGATTANQKVNLALAAKPSGCVVWMRFDPETLDFKEFLWFGGGPGALLPDLGTAIAKHTKANAEGYKAERPKIRVLTKAKFDRVAGIEPLVDRLFGPA